MRQAAALGAVASGGQGKQVTNAVGVAEVIATLGARKGRQTSRYGTKFERARLVGEWAERISAGDDPRVDLSAIDERSRDRYVDPLNLAELALDQKTIPLAVRRFFADGSHEDWPARDLVFF
jgi:DNA-directed RNA polymerase subunit K/omega